MTLPAVFLHILLFGAVGLHRSFAKEPTASGSTDPSSPQRQLKRSTGKRWDAIHDMIRADIKSATKHFLEERSRALVLPIEVDLLLVGFDGDGGYGYQLDRHALDELLGTATEDNTICPTVWETGESAAVCYSVNYITLDPADSRKGIERMEAALVHNMEWVGDRSMDWSDGSHEVMVYEVEANGEIEATVWELLDDAYGGKEPEVNRRQHSQIVIINPSKLRMRAHLPEPPGGHSADHSTSDPVLAHHEREMADVDFIDQWMKGRVTSSHVVEQEAGFLYRYRYGGRGSGAAFVGQYNFLVIDISAGPVSYGPLTSPAGAVTPTAMPRLMPMLLRMTRELEANTQPGTLRAHMLQEAARGQAAVFAGQLASVVAAATRHLFASDLLLSAAEGLGGVTYQDGPKRVVVPIIVMQDHVRYLDHEGDGSGWVDTDMVQLALDEILPPDISGSVTVSRHMLHHHKQLATALVKARISRSDAVLMEPPDFGLHRSQVTSLDSALLLGELRLAAADDDLLGGLVDHVGADDYTERLPYMDDPTEFMRRRRRDTKVLPVFVFSLERSPEQLLFDNKQLVASAHDVVAVLQLLGNPQSDDERRGRVYSGHMSESHPVLLDADQQPSRAIVAGLAAALGGLVPAHQRYCRAERAVVEDWRWAVGAVPWGPYSNYTALSSVFAASARRNVLVARIERPLRKLIAVLNRLDQFIAAHLQGPFAFLRVKSAPPPSSYDGYATPAALYHNLPHHHLLDDLARLHKRFQNTSEGGAKRLVNHLMNTVRGSKPGASETKTPSAPSPSSSADSPDSPHHQQQQPQQPELQRHGRHLQGFQDSSGGDGHGDHHNHRQDLDHHHDQHWGSHHGSSSHHAGGSGDAEWADGGDNHYMYHHYEATHHEDAPAGRHHGTDSHEYDPSAYEQPVLLSEEEVAARAASPGGGAASADANRADLLLNQQALTPNVAQRLQASLDEIGLLLEHVAYLMFNRNWAELEDHLGPLHAAVDLFSAAVDRELHHAAEVVGCCTVRHIPAGSGTWFAVGLVVTLLGVFGIAAALVIRSQKMYMPRVGSSGGMSSGGAARTLSRGRSLSGSLPSWAGPPLGSPLPR